MRNAEKRKKMKLAIEIQKNLEEAALGKSAHDPARGFGVSWVDGKIKKIDFIPDVDNRGMSIYVYVEGKRTAQMGLSIKAALILADGIHKMISKNPEMLAAVE